MEKARECWVERDADTALTWKRRARRRKEGVSRWEWDERMDELQGKKEEGVRLIRLGKPLERDALFIMIITPKTITEYIVGIFDSSIINYQQSSDGRLFLAKLLVFLDSQTDPSLGVFRVLSGGLLTGSVRRAFSFSFYSSQPPTPPASFRCSDPESTFPWEPSFNWHEPSEQLTFRCAARSRQCVASCLALFGSPAHRWTFWWLCTPIRLPWFRRRISEVSLVSLIADVIRLSPREPSRRHNPRE